MLNYMWRLKFCGCGHAVDLEVDARDSTVQTVIDAVASKTGLAPHHLKLLWRGKELGGGDGAVGLEASGLQDRTKLMLMHTAAYHAEAKTVDELKAIRADADAVADPHGPSGQERLTQLLCKLDAVDTGGSDWLRARRKCEINYVNALADRRKSDPPR